MTAWPGCTPLAPGLRLIRRRLLAASGLKGLGMNIETDDLANLRETTSKALLAVLWLHVPIAVAIGVARGEGWIAPAIIMVAMALAATASWRMSGNGLSTRMIFAV